MIKMIRPAAIIGAIMLAAAPAFAQGHGSLQGFSARSLAVLGQTGTMYDGNNANLQLPPEQNAYWARLWAEAGTAGNSGATAAVGAGTAGSSLGGTQGGGEH
jgi:hypothetical protein